MKKLKLKTGVFLLGGLILGALVGMLILRQDPGESASKDRLLPPTVGTEVPDFELSTLGGSSLALNSIRGKPLVINFWTTWCGPCKEEMPLLEAYAQKYTGKLVVMGINSAENEETVQPYIDDMEISFPILLDKAGIVSDRYFVKNFPYTFFVDENGILRGQHIGLLSEERLMMYLKTIGIEP